MKYFLLSFLMIICFTLAYNDIDVLLSTESSIILSSTNRNNITVANNTISIDNFNSSNQCIIFLPNQSVSSSSSSIIIPSSSSSSSGSRFISSSSAIIQQQSSSLLSSSLLSSSKFSTSLPQSSSSLLSSSLLASSKIISSSLLSSSVLQQSSSLFSSSSGFTAQYPSAKYYTLSSFCNISTAQYSQTISGSSYSINYFANTFGPGNNQLFYMVWNNLGFTPNDSGTYLIGVNTESGFRLTINGVVYADSLYDPYTLQQAKGLYSMAASVSLTQGVTYPIILEYCSQSCTGCNKMQLLYSPPYNSTIISNIMTPIFQTSSSAANISIVPSLVSFIPFNLNPIITNATTSITSSNTIGPQIPGAPGNPQTTCSSIPWTNVSGSCPTCQQFSWFTSGTYQFTPTSQCTSAWVQAWGASGQDGGVNFKGGFCAQPGTPSSAYGGAGGYTSAVVTLTANTVYTITVGTGGNSYQTIAGNGAFISNLGCGIGTSSGGGYSGISLNSQPILIAGGGGGGGSLTNGGSGGGLIGGNSSGLYSGTGGSSVSQQAGTTTPGNFAFQSGIFSYYLYESCVGANYGQFIYAGGGGGLYQGGNGAISACDISQTINTDLLSFWGAGGGSGYMCGTGSTGGMTQYGITINGDNSSIPRPAPYYPGAAYPNQLISSHGNDGGIQITCLNSNPVISTTQPIVNTTQQQIFGNLDPIIDNPCPPYSMLHTSSAICNNIPFPLVAPPSAQPNCPSNKVYYVSSSLGNDNNNGLSPSAAWATLSHVNSMLQSSSQGSIFFQPGDTIMFCNGDVFMRQIMFLTIPYIYIPAPAEYPLCAVRFTSYVCNQNNANLLPLFTVSSLLPQTPLVGWEPVTWNLLNGSTINLLMYNFSLLDSLTVSQTYLPPISNRQAQGVANVWVNGFPYMSARHPNVVDMSVFDYNHQYGTTLYEWMHLDPNDAIENNVNGGSTLGCFTPPNTRVSPGSWCNHIWHDMFGQNTTLMKQLLNNGHFFDNAIIFSNGEQGYTSNTYPLGGVDGYVLNGSSTFDCNQWYNLVVAPFFPPNVTWGNPILDSLPVPSYLSNNLHHAYFTGWTVRGSIICDSKQAQMDFPYGIPNSVKNISYFSSTSGQQIASAYNGPFILSNHYSFLDRPGEYWYNTTSDCLYIVPYNSQHQQLLTTTYNSYPLNQVNQIINQGASTSFLLAAVYFGDSDINDVFYVDGGNSDLIAAIFEIDSFEFAFGGSAIYAVYGTIVLHHSILRALSIGIETILSDLIATNNVIVNATTHCINQVGDLNVVLNVLVLNNTCAFVPAFSSLNTNGFTSEIVRGNSLVGTGCVAMGMSGGNTDTIVNGVVQPSIGEFNWIDNGQQLCAQWGALTSNQGVQRYNEITNLQSGNWAYLHLVSYGYPLSQSGGISTIQNNEIMDNNILINCSGNGLYTFQENHQGLGFTTMTNNLLINSQYFSDNINYLYVGNNQFIATANVLPNQAGPGQYMYSPQINAGSTDTVIPSSQTSFCNGLLDQTQFPSLPLYTYWNGLGISSTYGTGKQSVDLNIPSIQPSRLYTNVNPETIEFVSQNTDMIQQYNAGMYNWIKESLDNSQITWGADNCTYYAEQQLKLKRAQNCQARINSEPGIWQQIYALYPNYHALTGMCWPPTQDRVI